MPNQAERLSAIINTTVDGTLVELTAELIKRDLATDQVAIEVAGSSPSVQADAAMLKMVIQNLLLNGRLDVDCPPGGGTTVTIQLPHA
jgi:hypothetical protein